MSKYSAGIKLTRLVLFPISIFMAVTGAIGQVHHYSSSNAHSHNDYEQKQPFRLAYDAGFGSIEADIFLVDSVLYVAHDTVELRYKRKLEDLYLIPLVQSLKKNNGYPYSDQHKKLQMLIDIKDDSIATLNALIRILNSYPVLIQYESLNWVITGNRPDPQLFTSYPSYILFDGVLSRSYNKESLSRIAMMSDDFKGYSSWNADSPLPLKDDSVLTFIIAKAHKLNKPVRFWNAPDNELAWSEFMKLQADFINTDHIRVLSDFLIKSTQTR